MNIEFAGEALAEIWSKMTIDGYPVIAECVTTNGSDLKVTEVSADWYANHVQESQYFLQVRNSDSIITFTNL